MSDAFKTLPELSEKQKGVLGFSSVGLGKVTTP